MSMYQEMAILKNGNDTLQSCITIIQNAKVAKVPTGLEQGVKSMMWKVPELMQDRYDVNFVYFLCIHIDILIIFDIFDILDYFDYLIYLKCSYYIYYIDLYLIMVFLLHVK